MLNPDDPLQVTAAVGGAIGVRVRRFALILRGLYQGKNGYTGSDLTAEGRTFWGLAAEYALMISEGDQREGVVQVGLGRLHRSHFRTPWFAQLGLGGRYRVAPPVALLVSAQDLVAFLPTEASRCDPIPGGQFCIAPVVGQIQHNLGLVLAVELIP
jgi:hypothetical protein